MTTLVLPLLVLAIPLLDTSFVVARRIKHGQPVYVADRQHLHHRFEAVGFSQRRAVLYLYGWCLTLTLAALATKFVAPHPHGRWDWSNVAIDATVALLAIGASVYIVYLLEIVKLANPFIRRREELERATERRRSPSRPLAQHATKSHGLRTTKRLALSHSPLSELARLRYAPARWSPPSAARFRLPKQAAS